MAIRFDDNDLFTFHVKGFIDELTVSSRPASIA
nr:MAG TPA: hypothetical protein [Bacteriophage sp.]